MKKGYRIRITDAEGVTDRTVYAVFEDGWYDTHGTFWPFDTDQFLYARLEGPRP